MTPAEAAVLLAAIAASDNREVTESAARSWASSLPDVALSDALEVLPEYYRTATRDRRNWIYPGDVLELVREMHRRNRAAVVLQAREEFMNANADADSDLRAIGAMKAARDEYNRTHQVPTDGRRDDESPTVRALRASS